MNEDFKHHYEPDEIEEGEIIDDYELCPRDLKRKRSKSGERSIYHHLNKKIRSSKGSKIRSSSRLTRSIRRHSHSMKRSHSITKKGRYRSRSQSRSSGRITRSIRNRRHSNSKLRSPSMTKNVRYRSRSQSRSSGRITRTIRTYSHSRSRSLSMKKKGRYRSRSQRRSSRRTIRRHSRSRSRSFYSRKSRYRSRSSGRTTRSSRRHSSSRPRSPFSSGKVRSRSRSSQSCKRTISRSSRRTRSIIRYSRSRSKSPSLSRKVVYRSRSRSVSSLLTERFTISIRRRCQSRSRSLSRSYESSGRSIRRKVRSRSSSRSRSSQRVKRSTRELSHSRLRYGHKSLKNRSRSRSLKRKVRTKGSTKNERSGQESKDGNYTRALEQHIQKRLSEERRKEKKRQSWIEEYKKKLELFTKVNEQKVQIEDRLNEDENMKQLHVSKRIRLESDCTQNEVEKTAELSQQSTTIAKQLQNSDSDTSKINRKLNVKPNTSELDCIIEERRILMKVHEYISLEQYSYQQIDEVARLVVNDNIPVSSLAKRLDLIDNDVMKWVADTCHYYGELRLRDYNDQAIPFDENDFQFAKDHNLTINVRECVKRYVKYLYLEEDGRFKKILADTVKQLNMAWILLGNPNDGFDQAYGINKKEFIKRLKENLPSQVNGMSFQTAIKFLVLIKNEQEDKENEKRDNTRKDRILVNKGVNKKAVDEQFKKVFSSLSKRRD